MSIFGRMFGRISGIFTGPSDKNIESSALSVSDSSGERSPTGSSVHSEKISMESDISIPPDFTRYFVSYNYSNRRGSGYGCMEIARRKPVCSMADVESMTGLIQDTLRNRYGYADPRVVILHWKPFEIDDADRTRAPIPNAEEDIVLRLVA